MECITIMTSVLSMYKTIDIVDSLMSHFYISINVNDIGKITGRGGSTLK